MIITPNSGSLNLIITLNSGSLNLMCAHVLVTPSTSYDTCVWNGNDC